MHIIEKTGIVLFGILCVGMSIWTFPAKASMTYENNIYEGQNTDIGLKVQGRSVFGNNVDMDKPKVDTGDEGYTVTYGGMSVSIPVTDGQESVEGIREIRQTGVEAEYNGKLYYSDTPDPACVSISAVYEDGTRIETDADYQLPSSVYENTEIPVHSDFGDVVLKLDLEEPDRIEAFAKVPLHEYDTMDKSEFVFSFLYPDGEKRDFYEDGKICISNGMKIETAYGTAELVSDVVPITDTAIENMEDLREGDILESFTAIISYEDGEEKRIEPDGFHGTVLERGENIISFKYNGHDFSCPVQARALTNVENALPGMDKEIEESAFSHISGTCIVTITPVYGSESFCYLTHVIVNEPSQVMAGLSHNTYGGDRETPTDAAERLGWVVGTNGSNFRYSDGKPDMANVRIKNGEIMDDSMDICNGMEICLLPDGNVFAPPQGMTATELLHMGVTDTWCCGDTVLIQNGEPVNEEIQSEQYRYPRTAFGMVRPCEYYLITAGDGGYENGMTYTEIRDVLLSHGCVFGKCMDGGGSASLVFEGELVNTPATDEERPVSDFLYFTD